MSLEVAAVLEGKITGISKFGAFVALPDGKSGMVHISEIASTFVKEITDHVKQDQVVKVRILGVDDKGRISLSIKKAMENEPRVRKVSFEDMLNKYMQDSTEKISDLKNYAEPNKRRGGSGKAGGASIK